MKKVNSIIEIYTKNRAQQLAEALSKELTNALVKYFKGFNINFAKYSDF